jgi:thiosulfate reductase/polysulfide reductase chain A
MAITPSRRTFLQVAAAGTAVAAIPVGVRELATPPAAAAAETPGTEKVVTSVCEMCTVRCPILVRVRDGKVMRIEGNPKEKSTKGAICAWQRRDLAAGGPRPGAHPAHPGGRAR